MECSFHEGVEPVGRCVVCGALLCESCARDRGRFYCLEHDPYPVPSFEEPGKEITRLDVWRALEYVLDDSDWLKKVVIGGFVVLGSPLVIPYLLLLGYICEAVRAVARGEESTLPSWKDPVSKIELGAKLLAVKLVYLIPVFLVLTGTCALGVFGGRVIGHNLLEGLLVTIFTFGWLISAFFFVAYRLVNPAFTARLAIDGKIEEALETRDILESVFERKREFLIALCVSLFLTPVITMVGFFFFCIGTIFFAFYAIMVNAHVSGQLARGAVPAKGLKRVPPEVA